MIIFSKDKYVRVDGAVIGAYDVMLDSMSLIDCWFCDSKYTRKIDAVFAKTKKELKEKLKNLLLQTEINA